MLVLAKKTEPLRTPKKGEFQERKLDQTLPLRKKKKDGNL